VRVPGLQEGSAPWRGESGELGEKHLLGLKPYVLELTLLLPICLSASDLGQGLVHNEGPWGLSRESWPKTSHTHRIPSYGPQVLKGPVRNMVEGSGRLAYPLVPTPDTAEDAESS
jgi:hypothetical protein